ncbi:MAG: NYN domain-containing protein [Acidimicrobiales bacterium]
MAPSHAVVDGSNIATEGRSMPSLKQLDEAVRQFQDEFPDVEPIVVVDATFGHRIDPGERKAFDEAVAHGELVSPPAGAIGRGDAFVLRIAERVKGTVLSNDSFQEFHEEHPWLFDEGRLLGGKPVPGVGWIFTPRSPVRGPRPKTGRARQAAKKGAPGRAEPKVLEAVEAAAASATEAATEAVPPTPRATRGRVGAGQRGRRGGRRRRTKGDAEIAAAIEAATEEAIGPEAKLATGKAKRRAAPEPSAPTAINDPLTFLTFISEHALGDTVEGVVSSFVSHGAMVEVGDMLCYVPLSGLAEPAPKSAREVLKRGDRRAFRVVALDPPRRGAQLALPELAGAMKEAAAGKRPAKKAATGAAKAPAKAAKSAKAPKAPKAAKAEKNAPAKAAAKAAKAAKKAPAKTAPAKAAKAPAKPAAKAAKAAKPAAKPAKAAKAQEKKAQPAKKAPTASKRRDRRTH